MEISEILRHVDHTLLTQTATFEEVQSVLLDTERFHAASACIPPSMVERARAFIGDRVKLCTVIGFPNGYQTNQVKAFECEAAIADGADELDVVIDLGDLKEKKDKKIIADLRLLKQICGDRILKVIVETCFLTQEEKVRACNIVTESGADFIKTSTGFGSAGATREDVALFFASVGEGVKIKAAGGISSLKDAEDFLRLGASRLGTSKIVKIAKGGIL